MCPHVMFSGTRLLKRATPALGLPPGTVFKARGSGRVMKWEQQRTAIMSW